MTYFTLTEYVVQQKYYRGFIARGALDYVLVRFTVDSLDGDLLWSGLRHELDALVVAGELGVEFEFLVWQKVRPFVFVDQ